MIATVKSNIGKSKLANYKKLNSKIAKSKTAISNIVKEQSYMDSYLYLFVLLNPT